MNIGQGNFPILNKSQTNPALTALQDQIVRHLANQHAKLANKGIGIDNQVKQAQLPYAGDMAYQSDLAKQIANKYNPMLDQANMDNMQQRTLAQKLQNQMYPQEEQAKIDQMKAMQDYYKSGGFGSHRGAQNQDYQHALDMVAQDNPNLADDPKKIAAATRALADGKIMLDDGTVLNKPGALTQSALGKLVKYGTTAPSLTNQISANQASKELDALYDIQKDYLGDYGTTLAGKSPKAIMDSFKNDDESQERLGKFLAGNQLNYEGSQLVQRIASKPTVAGMNEILKSSQTQIDQKYPRMSQKARVAYMNAMKDALNKILSARNQVGIQAYGQPGVMGAQNVQQAQNQSQSAGSKEAPDPLGIR